MDRTLVRINSPEDSIAEFEEKIKHEQDRLWAKFVKSVTREMKEQELTQTDLAWTLGKKRSYVSRILASPQNMTIKTLVELAYALDLNIDMELGSNRPSEFKNVTSFNPSQDIVKRLKRDVCIGDASSLARAM